MVETKKSGDINASKKMLDETRNELKADIASLNVGMKFGFERVDSEIRDLKTDVKGLKIKVRSGFKRMDSEISSLKTEMRSGFKRVDSEISSLKTEMRSGFKRVDSEISSLKTELKEVKSDIRDIKVDLGEIKTSIMGLTAVVHRTLALYEEQETRNKYVLDGYQNLYDRQERFEKEIKDDVAAIKVAVLKKVQ